MVGVKCAEISDETFLAAVDEAARLRGFYSATRWDVACVLANRPDLVGVVEGEERSTQDFPQMPPKLVLAKARKLIRRGLVTGCACGCRGDFLRAQVATATPA